MEKEKITFNIEKNKNFSEWYTEIIKKAELADIRYNVKGFIVFQPWSVLAMEKMFHFMESTLQKKGHMPYYFPTVIPEKNFKKESHHVKGFTPEVFWLEAVKGEDKLALRPTSETAFYQMFALWINSYKDLPFKTYQRANVFRYETKEVLHDIYGLPFIFFQRTEWDKFPGAKYTYAADVLNPDGRVVQQPSTHLLEQEFAKAFDVKDR